MSQLVTLFPIAALAVVLLIAIVAFSQHWQRGIEVIAREVERVVRPLGIANDRARALLAIRAEAADLLDLPNNVVTVRVDYAAQRGPICGVVVTLRSDRGLGHVLELESAVRRELPMGVTFRIDVRPVPTDTVRLSSGAA